MEDEKAIAKVDVALATCKAEQFGRNMIKRFGLIVTVLIISFSFFCKSFLVRRLLCKFSISYHKLDLFNPLVMIFGQDRGVLTLEIPILEKLMIIIYDC